MVAIQATRPPAFFRCLAGLDNKHKANTSLSLVSHWRPTGRCAYLLVKELQQLYRLFTLSPSSLTKKTMYFTHPSPYPK